MQGVFFICDANKKWRPKVAIVYSRFSSQLEHHKVVLMNEFVSDILTQELMHLGGLLAENELQRFAVELRDTACHGFAVLAQDFNQVALVKMLLDGAHTYGQQAGMLFAQSLHATFVDHHGPARSRHEAEPALTAVELFLGAHKERSFGVFKNHLMRQHLHATGEEGVATALGHITDGFELAAHTAGTHCRARFAGLTRKRQNGRRNFRHKTEESGVRVLLRIVIEESIFIREKNYPCSSCRNGIA